MDKTTEMRELYDTAYDYIGRLIAGIGDAAGLLKEGNTDEAMKMMGNISEGLQWLTDAVRLTQDIQIDKIDVAEVNPFILELVSAFENRDFVLIGDLLEYEINPILEKWKGLMEKQALN